MDKPELKPCPFCGGKAVLYGQEIRDCVNGERAKLLRKEYWVKTHCDITCIYAMTAGRAFGIYDGIHYRTPEAAAEAWNRRADSKISVGDTVYQTDGVRVYEKIERPLERIRVAKLTAPQWLEDEYGYCRCSRCGYEHDDPETTTPYCPECGARMGGMTEVTED